MFVGYARVSTGDQNLDLQMDALKAAGCDKVFTDRLPGAKDDRPGLGEALEFVRGGDTLVVWRLDRLGRSLPHLIETTTGLEARSVGFKSLQEGTTRRPRAANSCSTSSGRWPSSSARSSGSGRTPGLKPLRRGEGMAVGPRP